MKSSIMARRVRTSAVSLRTRLLFLVVSLLLPALAASAFLIWDSSNRAYALQERQLVATATTLSLVVDRQLSQQTAMLNALATSDSLEIGDWDRFDRRARRALAGSQTWVAVRTLDGQQLVNTLSPTRTALPKVANPRVPPNRPPRADGVRVADMAMGALAGEPVTTVVKAVTLKDGRVVDLSIVTPARAFSDLLRRQRLSPKWIATILDGRHRVVARSRDEERFRGQTATPVITRHLTPGASGVIWGRSLDGVPTRTAYEPVADSNWTVLLAVPRDELLAPARQALRAGAPVALVLLLGGIAMAVVAARAITRSVRSLQSAVARGDGETFVRPPPSRLVEIEDLADAFAQAAAHVADHNASQQLLINELNHRVKNTLATLQSVSIATRRSAVTVDEFYAALEGRIMALSGAHELLTRTAWTRTDLADLARMATRPFGGPRLTIAGPEVRVEPTDALNLTLIFYELANNASKYGALSGPTGQASIAWTQDGDQVRIMWTETGGPPVLPPATRGFGSRLIETVRAGLGPSQYAFHPTGVQCSLTLTVRSSKRALRQPDA